MGRPKIEIKNRRQIEYQREAALIVNEIHKAIYRSVCAGITPAEIDAISAGVIAHHGAKSNFLGYYGYPATICISVNDTVVHGIPDHRPFRVGDLVSFDCGCYVERDGQQWHGDSAFSIIIGKEPPLPLASDISLAANIGKSDTKTEQLCELTRLAMWAGVASLGQRKHVGTVGEAVESLVEKYAIKWGWTADIVEEFIGHGIGTQMHQPPDVLNYRTGGRQVKLQTGMVLCVEPILTAGRNKCITLADGWTVKTKDNSLACHWESQVAILEEGICVLNQEDCGAAGLAPFGIVPVTL